MHKFFALSDIMGVVEAKEAALEPLSAYLYHKILRMLPTKSLYDDHFKVILGRLFQSIDRGSLALALDGEEVELLVVHYPCMIDGDRSPLVLDNDFLYLHRYWSLEESFIRLLKKEVFERSATTHWEVDSLSQDTILKEWCNREPEMSDTLYQAGKIMITSDFLLLSGGPGSGKTYSLARVLKLMDILARHSQRELSVLLSAPTAKAVARIHESITQSLQALGGLEQFHLSLHTLHRALGYNIRGSVKYSKENPWQYDLVVVDEVSMVDIHLFGQLLSALKPSSKLILIGDADQLPSVASGAVLSELVYSYLNREQIPESVDYKLEKNIIFLTGNRRVPPEILALAQNFLHGEKDQISAKFHAPAREHVEFHALNQASFMKFYGWLHQEYRFSDTVTKNLGYYDQEGGLSEKQKEHIGEFFQKYENFIVISPIHRGAYGVETINQNLSQSFGGDAKFYHGMPIVLTVNQPAYELSNGDRGVILRFDDIYYAVFKRGEKLYDCYLPNELVAYEVAYAITVHKSQGSEYQRVVLVLPDNAERLLERRLVYTAITRAKKQIMIFSNIKELTIAAVTSSPRVSQIAKKLL